MASSNNDWWLIKTSNGAVGLVRGIPPANAVHKVFVASASDFNDLANNHAQALGAAQGKIGATVKQLAVLVSQIDHGAGLHNPNWLYVGSDAGGNTPSSNVQTGLGSEAAGTSLIPGTAGIVNALSNFSPANILSVLGNLQFWKGIGLVLGGVVILVIVGRELVKV